MLICPITRTPFSDLENPVSLRGYPQHIFEMTALAHWIHIAGTNPLTRRPVSFQDIIVLDAAQGKQKRDKTINLLHELSNKKKMENTPPLNPDPFEKICIDFIEGFRRAFVITGNGALGCDQAIRRETPMWYNSQARLIASYVGFAPPVLRLQEPAGQSDITTTNHNKIEMIRAYAYAFIVYHKMCTIIGYTTTLHPEYTPEVDVETNNTEEVPQTVESI